MCTDVANWSVPSCSHSDWFRGGHVAKKKPVLAPCWDRFFDLLFFAFVIIIIQNGWPQRILPLYLTVTLKCLCSEPCPPVDCRQEEIINTSPA